MELDSSISTDKEPNNTEDKMSSSSSNGQAYATPATTRLRSSYDINVIRLIGQHLNSLGLKQTVELLLRETGVPSLDHPLADSIQRYILAGEFDSANSLVEELADLVVTPYTKTVPPAESSKSYKVQKLKTADGDHASHFATEDSLNGKRKCSLSSRYSDKKQIISGMKLAIAEQKYLELLEDKQRMEALRCLQSEITPFVAADDRDHLTNLATLILCKSTEDLRQRANWPGKGPQSRQLVIDKLRNHVPPLLLLPAGRLGTLLNQAAQLQRERCAFHIEQSLVCGNTFNPNDLTANNETKPNETDRPAMSSCDNTAHTSATYPLNKQTNGHCATATRNHEPSLASPSSSSLSLDTPNSHNINHTDLVCDHACSSDKFPMQRLHTYENHKSEIWYCQFSNDGLKLATGGLGGKVKIWQMDPARQELIFKCTFDCSTYSVACLSWSPDDAYLLACGAEERSNLWLINVKKGELQSSISHSDTSETAVSYTTCSWHMNGKRFAAASLQGNFQLFDLDCNQLGKREGVRVQCMSFLHKDPKYVLAADIQNRIRAYSLDDMCRLDTIGSDDRDVIEESFPIISFVVSPDDKYIAVNLQMQGIHLWDYKTMTLMRVYNGVSQRNMAIYSSFSSLPKPIFLASGSEDGNVYVYHINKPDRPLIVLSGHSRCVNCVTWNPRYPEFLVSVSDDRHVTLWGPESFQTASNSTETK